MLPPPGVNLIRPNRCVLSFLCFHSRAQELALRQLLRERGLNRARAEGELQRALAEGRRLDADCQRLLELSNTLRAQLRVRWLGMIDTHSRHE